MNAFSEEDGGPFSKGFSLRPRGNRKRLCVSRLLKTCQELTSLAGPARNGSAAESKLSMYAEFSHKSANIMS